MNCRSFLILLLLLALVLDARGADQSLAGSTIVIYNESVPESVQLAKFYAQQRGIERDHLVGLKCPTAEEISRQEYDTTISDPLRKIFKERRWWTMEQTPDGKEKVATTAIHFAATIKGIPLKIRPTAEPYPGDEPGQGPIASHNEASVDSELALLPFFLRQISGAFPNAYFQSFRAISDFTDATPLLVSRLDAPTAAMVRRMITDAIAAEKNGLWGRAYVDSAHNAVPGGRAGDEWMTAIVDQLHKVGVPVIFEDTPALFPAGYPMTDCALYYGWYASGVTGPFADPDFHFLPGAVAVHIHSTSAVTLRDEKAAWVAPLLARGAAASIGNVYEPYLQLTVHLDILNDRLMHGFTFAESVCMASYGLSWMSVAIGDPLYRPYASWMQIDASRDASKPAGNWKMYHEFAVKYFPNSSTQYRQSARTAAARAGNCPMLEDLGAMEARDGNFPNAVGYFSQARACYTTRDDILRVVMEESDALIRQNKQKRALDLIRSVLRIVTGAPSEPLLRNLERNLGGSPQR